MYDTIFPQIITARLIFITAMVNLVTIGLIFLSCRCIPVAKRWGWLTQHQAYKHFLKYHCYIWWVLWTSVIVHATIAITFLGIPF